jgi:hypothetical protein
MAQEQTFHQPINARKLTRILLIEIAVAVAYGVFLHFCVWK